jgi:N-acetylneuraminic acid mutarotase
MTKPVWNGKGPNLSLGRNSMLTRRLFAKALYLLFVIALLVALLGAAPAQPIQAAPAALPGATSPEGLLNPDGTLDMAAGFQGTLDLSGWQVTLDGERGPVLKPAASSAAPSTPGWHALPNQGLDNTVYALAMVGTDLYVAGVFAKTGDGAIANLTGIARYSTADGAWHALNNEGLNNTVRALAVVGSDLYVGGLFTQTGDGSLTNLGRIARYDTTSGTWHALSHQGLDNAVYDLMVAGRDLYVGGVFDRTGDGSLTKLGRIARYDTTSDTWHALNRQGLNSTVHALVMEGSNLYVGGEFTSTGDGLLKKLGYIARYDTEAGTWHGLNHRGLNSWVMAMAIVGSDLYVGGEFNMTADFVLPLGKIARYDIIGDTWHTLNNQGLDAFVSALNAVGSDLYVGGGFVQTGDASRSLNRIARYQTTTGTWHGLRNQGLDAPVYALEVSGDDLYVGGWFAQTRDGALTLGRIARYRDVPYFAYLPLIAR